MTGRWFIDQPAGGRFKTVDRTVVGWFACEQGAGLERAVLRGVEGGERVERPDVEAAFPRWSVLGFRGTVTGTKIGIEVDGETVAELDLDPATALRRAREAKRQWCLDHARCPACTNPELTIERERIECERCGTVYPQSGQAINLLSDELYRASSLEETANVSSNHYDPASWEIVAEVEKAGGKVLDCGAGSRSIASETVVNLEIIDVPSTDVLGVGQSLPFRDQCFEAVFSHAVLEHVSDPFACAREMVRVLKPGGQLYVSVPFLQPEHGYPNHFYNMTRAGVRNLFPGLVTVRHEVPGWGLPVLGLHWMVRLYAAHLEEKAREKFLGMTMGQLIAKGQYDYGEDEIVTGMTESGKWELACTTALLMRKGE